MREIREDDPDAIVFMYGGDSDLFTYLTEVHLIAPTPHQHGPGYYFVDSTKLVASGLWKLKTSAAAALMFTLAPKDDYGKGIRGVGLVKAHEKESFMNFVNSDKWCFDKAEGAPPEVQHEWKSELFEATKDWRQGAAAEENKTRINGMTYDVVHRQVQLRLGGVVKEEYLVKKSQVHKATAVKFIKDRNEIKATQTGKGNQQPYYFPNRGSLLCLPPSPSVFSS